LIIIALKWTIMLNYTVGHKKTCHFYFYDNFGKCGPISQSIYESKSERIIEIGPHLPKLS